MDDIGIATQTNMMDHITAVCDVLSIAKEHDLYFKPEKCMFHVPSMDYLGVILEKGVTCMDVTFSLKDTYLMVMTTWVSGT